VKRFTFQNGSYVCHVDIELQNLSAVIANFEYYLTWDSPLPYAENNSVSESGFAMAYVYAGEELAEVDAGSSEDVSRIDINGLTAWVAARNKYFGIAMVPGEGASQGAYVEGRKFHVEHSGIVEKYRLNLKMPFKGGAQEKTSVEVFLGPLDFDIVKSAGKDLDRIMSLGVWIIRPISEYVMIPLFRLIHFFIPNFGIVIIVFSIIIKAALHPLSKSSMTSMRKMQALQPMMNEIREKHKDDPQKMNQSMMNLYKDYGVNPASGCLPLLLQMPILFALYSVFQSAIELRQASFFLWITDLSIPDILFTLPFSIPVLGTSDVSGLALAMGITMFVQQKMTVTDPRQKAMVWMMPIMMTLLFNSLPSGLNLYYFIFNLLSIGQQVWLKKTHPDEPPRKIDRRKTSGGLIGRLTKDLPKIKR
jgi:YidC/Oxa1 family membrane protein insertase